MEHTVNTNNRLDTPRAVERASHVSIDPKYFSRLVEVRFSEILKEKNAQELIQDLSPQVLYHSLKIQGLNDSLEVLELISQEQFGRLLDFDCWRESSLVPGRVFEWLSAYKELSPALMVERFASLEEEYQLAVFNRLVRVYTNEEYEKMEDSVQDRLYRFPSDALFYEILTDDNELAGQIESFVEAAMGQDMAYVMNLIAMAAMMPPFESEAQALRFREARLTEEGFVPYEEGLELCRPLPLQQLEEKWRRQGASSALQDPSRDSTLLDRALALNDSQELTFGFLALANALGSANRMESDDRAGLKLVLEQAHALVNLGLEHLAGGDDAYALRILKAEYPKTIYRYGLGLIAGIQDIYVLALRLCGEEKSERIRKLIAQGRFHAIAEELDKNWLKVLGLEEVERLKTLFDVMPKALVVGEDKRLTAVVIPDQNGLRKLAYEALSFYALIQILRQAEYTTELGDIDRALVQGFTRLMAGEPFALISLEEKKKLVLQQLSAEQFDKVAEEAMQILRREALKSALLYCQDLRLDEKLLDAYLGRFLKARLLPFIAGRIIE